MSNALQILNCLDELDVKQFFRKAITASLIFLVAFHMPLGCWTNYRNFLFLSNQVQIPQLGIHGAPHPTLSYAMFFQCAPKKAFCMNQVGLLGSWNRLQSALSSFIVFIILGFHYFRFFCFCKYFQYFPAHLTVHLLQGIISCIQWILISSSTELLSFVCNYIL